MRGTVHSISNGEIRIASNLTRTYSTATVDLDGIADKDVESVIEILDAVGLAIAEDETYAPFLLDVPKYAGTIRLSPMGATLRMSGRTLPEGRVQVETEMRRRISAGLAAKGIEAIRPSAYGAPAPR